MKSAFTVTAAAARSRGGVAGAWWAFEDVSKPSVFHMFAGNHKSLFNDDFMTSTSHS